MGRWGPGRRWRARIRGGPQRLLGENNWRFFQREQSLSGKRVKGGKEPTNCAPPLPRAHSRAEARRVGAAARSAHRNSTLPLRPLPRCPPLLLYQCRKCSTDLHIFPNIRDLFFSPLCGRRQARIQEKRSWSGARGNKEPFTTAPANARQKRCT